MENSSEQELLRNQAEKYANYLETPEGRLRIDLAFTNLEDMLPRATDSLCALDVGGGTGAVAVRLAQLGIHVTLLDPSAAMLDFARRSAAKVGFAERIAFKVGDAAQISKLFPAGSFDVVICHNVLEFVDDPGAVLSHIIRVMRGPSATLSLLVRSQAGEVLKAALQTGDLAAADVGLTAEWGQESLYGGNVRLFRAESLKTMLKDASLTIAAERGVRVLADYLPAQVSRSADYQRIFALERKLGRQSEYAAVARYIQFLARRGGS